MFALVRLSRRSMRQLGCVPLHIAGKLHYWVALVESEGLSVARGVKGFNDEALLGKRAGQRSIRLNAGYRAIYVESREGDSLIIDILEVNKHDY